VPDPKLKKPTDVIVQITSTGICRYDLHLIPCSVLSARRVAASGPSRSAWLSRRVRGDRAAAGDRVVAVSFNVSCAHVFHVRTGSALAVRDHAGE